MLDPNSLFLLILTGLQKGAIYALIALGLTLIFGTLGVVNFAHGALFMIAAYLTLVVGSQVGFIPAILIVPILLFAIGIIMERGLIRYFYDRPHTDQILVTFGLAIVIGEVMKVIFGANALPTQLPSWGEGQVLFYEAAANVPDNPFFNKMWQIPAPFLDGNVFFSKWRALLIFISLIVVGGLFALLQFTRFGLVVRAGMRDPLMLRFLGINITQKFTLVFGLGALLAGIAGVFGYPVSGVNPEVGMNWLVPSFLVVVIGGMGSLSGALLAALLLGMALSFSAEYSSIQQIAIYLVAVVVLLVRPRGLLGQKGVME
jgi:branched-chain amino acid transport system permease protein